MRVIVGIKLTPKEETRDTAINGKIQNLIPTTTTSQISPRI